MGLLKLTAVVAVLTFPGLAMAAEPVRASGSFQMGQLSSSLRAPGRHLKKGESQFQGVSILALVGGAASLASLGFAIANNNDIGDLQDQAAANQQLSQSQLAALNAQYAQLVASNSALQAQIDELIAQLKSRGSI